MLKAFDQVIVKALEKLNKKNDAKIRLEGSVFNRASMQKKDREVFLTLHAKKTKGTFEIELERLSEALEKHAYSLAKKDNDYVILFSKRGTLPKSVGHIDQGRREIHLNEKHVRRLSKILFPRN